MQHLQILPQNPRFHRTAGFAVRAVKRQAFADTHEGVS
jgi:hypothetical protein